MNKISEYKLLYYSYITKEIHTLLGIINTSFSPSLQTLYNFTLTCVCGFSKNLLYAAERNQTISYQATNAISGSTNERMHYQRTIFFLIKRGWVGCINMRKSLFHNKIKIKLNFHCPCNHHKENERTV